MKNDDLKLLGNKVDYPVNYCPDILERISNKNQDNDYRVIVNCEEFTSLCPKTKQPDFAKIFIEYIPVEYLVESKSLKLYLFSFRNHGAFHEDCVNMIAKDIFKLLTPKYIKVVGRFNIRGGISINPIVEIKGDSYGK
jgi:7-cyano-7-deazaguanine reductase